jgi:hypothetical protein
MKFNIVFDLNDKKDLVQLEMNGVFGYALIKNGYTFFFPKSFFEVNTQQKVPDIDVLEQAKFLINLNFDNTEAFSSWEKGFLTSIKNKLDNNYPLTDKQKSTVISLYGRRTNDSSEVLETKINGPIGVFNGVEDEVPF